MEPNERALLEEAVSLAKENNKLLRQMRRGARLQRLLHLLYWIVIIVLAVASYYYAQPYIQSFKEIYTEVGTQVDKFR